VNRPEPTPTPAASAAPSGPPVADPANVTDTPLGAAPPVHTLTPEEQLALFEKELKEKDWGHQPC